MLRQTCSVLLRRRTSALRAFATKPDLTLVEDRDGIRTITMNNPAKYNGWTDPMLRSWMGRFADAATDDSVKALILTGSGKYYCAGVDLSGTIKPMWPKQLHDQIYTFNKRVFDTFLEFPKPLCVAVNGPAIGASVTTATLADCVVAAEGASFSTPFARLGVPPEGCSSVHFARLMGPENAMRMLGMDGWAPSAKEAAAVGLINECVSPEDLLDAAHAQLRSRLANADYVKNHRGYADTAELLQVNDRESKDLADAFLAVPFLRAQADFLASKGKKKEALVFEALVATRPAWSLLL